MSNSRIFFRVDGSAEMGLGHVIRAMALMSFIADRYACAFISSSTDPFVREMLRSYGESVFIDPMEPEREAHVLASVIFPDDVLVIDGYQFDETYQLAIRKLVKKLVAVDDKAAYRFYADIIINHGNISSLPPYRHSEHAKVYSGFDYLMLRKPFLAAARNQRRVNLVNSAMVCMGGTDTFGVADKAVDACLLLPFLEKVHLVKGGNDALPDTWEKQINAGKLVIHQRLDASGLVALMLSSQIAITTASTIALEAACVKTGLLCGTVIDNQEAIYNQLLSNRCCIGIGDLKSLTAEEIAQQIQPLNDPQQVNFLTEQQAQKIDGRSAGRLAKIFDELVNG